MTPRLDAIFAALADPTRRHILRLLLEDDMAVTDVAATFPTSLAAISKHLGVLASAGLIERERRGRVTWCKLQPHALRDASIWIESFGMFEPFELDRIERVLRAEGLQHERHDGDHDDDESDDVDDTVHECPPSD